MPRELEIRTTILAKGKKPAVRKKEKDSNYNDVYADEALQLLDELQKLKANVRLHFVCHHFSQANKENVKQ